MGSVRLSTSGQDYTHNSPALANQQTWDKLTQGFQQHVVQPVSHFLSNNIGPVFDNGNSIIPTPFGMANGPAIESANHANSTAQKAQAVANTQSAVASYPNGVSPIEYVAGANHSSMVGNMGNTPPQQQYNTDSTGATTLPDIGTLLANYGDFKYQEFGKSLSDYINQAGDGSNLITSQLAALDKSRTGMKDQAQVGDATIKGMYGDLGKKLDTQAQGLADTNKQQQANNQASGKQAAQNLQDMAKATGSDYADLMKTIGFAVNPKDAAVKGMGENAALNQLVANDRTQTQANLLQETAGNQADEWARYQNQAGLVGNQQRADLQTTLQGYLADLANTEAQMRDQAQQQAIANAQNQYNADWNQYQQGYQNAFNTWNTGRQSQLDQANLRMQQQQLDAQSAQSLAQAQADSNKANLDQWKSMTPQEKAVSMFESQFSQPVAQQLNTIVSQALLYNGGDKGNNPTNMNPSAALDWIIKNHPSLTHPGNSAKLNAIQNALITIYGGAARPYTTNN